MLEAVARWAALDRKLDGLHALFEREVRAEATREKVVDRLHAELQEYKQDLLLNVLRPVFLDLIQLHDDIGKMVAAQPDGAKARPGPPPPRHDAGLSAGDRGHPLPPGGRALSLQEGDTFDPRRQRAVATVPTDDPARSKTIAARLRKGFQTQDGERVIRPEIVSVYALKCP